MKVFAIDPGSEQSAWVELGKQAGGRWEPLAWTKMPNEVVLEDVVAAGVKSVVVIEWTAPRGMPAAAQLFETLWWAGRFGQAAIDAGAVAHRIERKAVVRHLTGSQGGKDSNVRQALIDRYGGNGGKEAAIGRKASPGPLYGLKADMWQALALGLAFVEGVQTVENSLDR